MSPDFFTALAPLINPLAVKTLVFSSSDFPDKPSPFYGKWTKMGCFR
jgi:hypothetical protein